MHEHTITVVKQEVQVVETNAASYHQNYGERNFLY
jgi:hypothetical protein